MPHIILEYSANLITPNFSELFSECHQLLSIQLPTNIKSCKSRAVKCKNFYVGDGNVLNAFVHVTVKVMLGRTQERLQAVGQELLILLKKYFPESSQLNLQFSLEIIELVHPYIKN